MAVQRQSRITFIGMDIFSVNYSSQRPYDKVSEIKLEVVPKLFIPKNQSNNFHIIMDAIVQSDGFFRIEVAAGGVFSLSEDIDEKLRGIFMNQNAPAILFPYLRSFISTFTSGLGEATGTLILPPQMFNGDLPVIEETKKVPARKKRISSKKED